MNTTQHTQVKEVFDLTYSHNGHTTILKSGDAALMNWYKTNTYSNDPAYQNGKLQVRRHGATTAAPEFVRHPKVKCDMCNGTGWKIKSESASFPGIKCKTCHGTGKIASS